MKIENSKNTVAARIDAEGNVIVGDGNTITVINLKEAAQYKAMEARLKELGERFEYTQAKIAKYPDDQDFRTDLIKISEAQNAIKKQIEDLKKEILKLADDFSKIPIYTERLRLAKQYFEEGDFDKARTILDAESMTSELNALLSEKEILQLKNIENEQHMADIANEFLIKARLTVIDHPTPDRFEKTKSYFEQSLSANRNRKNIEWYAWFLYNNNQFTDALPYYTEVLEIYKNLNLTNPQTYQTDVARTLFNLGLLHRNQNEFFSAKKEYSEALEIYKDIERTNPQTYQLDVVRTLNELAGLHTNMYEFSNAQKEFSEALEISRDLAITNPQTYLPIVAESLNNLGLYHLNVNEFIIAEKEYNEALNIYRELEHNDPQTYLPIVAAVLNNLANLRSDKNEFESAQTGFKEALNIYRDLAHNNPQGYLPYMAMTLNNLAKLHEDNNEFAVAEEEYNEALKIRRDLAIKNPKTYLPFLAKTAINLSSFYRVTIPDRDKSLAFAREAGKSANHFLMIRPDMFAIFDKAQQVYSDWGLDKDTFIDDTFEE